MEQDRMRSEININEKLFGAEHIVYDWAEREKEIVIYMKSRSRTGICPICGELSVSYHGTYERKIQSVPIRMKPTYLYIKAYKISEIFPDCIQVADRFHLIANLIEKMREVFKEEIPAELFIQGGEILDSAPEKVKVLRIEPDSKQLEKYNYDNEIPVDENGNPVSYTAQANVSE